jgi:hypothetical protein
VIAATAPAVRTVTAGAVLPVVFPCGGMFVYAIPFVVVNSFVVGTPYFNMVALLVVIMLPVAAPFPILPVLGALPWSIV